MPAASVAARSRHFLLPRVGCLTALAGLLAACAKEDEPAVTEAPGTITVPQPRISPEGIQYDEANKRFSNSRQRSSPPGG
jgi:hypothetical protein